MRSSANGLGTTVLASGGEGGVDTFKPQGSLLTEFFLPNPFSLRTHWVISDFQAGTGGDRIDLSDEGHVIAFAQTDPGSVGIRAANGEWTCIPSERRCQRTLPSPDSLSY